MEAWWIAIAKKECARTNSPLIRTRIAHQTMLRTSLTTTVGTMRRFASTQAGAAAEQAASTIRSSAKESLGEAKGAIKHAEGSVKGAAQQAKASIPSPPPAPIVVGSPTIRRPVASVRGGVLGFLLGFGIASAYGYYYLLKEYNAASNLMLASVEELQSSTDKVSPLPPFLSVDTKHQQEPSLLTAFFVRTCVVVRQITSHLQRLNKLEADLKSLSSQSASKAEYEKNRLEMKKIVDGIHDEVLDVKKQVLDLPRPTKYMQ